MRLSVDRSGKEPKAFMLTCGSLAFARARAQFSCNFFACAGIRVQDNTYFKSLEEGVKAALDAKADIVVICAADDDYATLAPEAAKMIGDKAIFVVAGAPACIDVYKRQTASAMALSMSLRIHPSCLCKSTIFIIAHRFCDSLFD